MQAIQGLVRRIKWVYGDNRTGVTVSAVIRDASNAVVFTADMQEYTGLYFVDWTPTKAESHTLYLSSVSDPIVGGIQDIDVLPSHLAELHKIAGLDPKSPAFIPAGEGSMTSDDIQITVRGNCNTGHTLTRL